MESLRRHMYNVAVLSRQLGSNYDLKGDDLKLLEMAAGFHDVGKKFISSRILFGRRKLTGEEYEIIKRHPVIGADILKRDGFHERVVEAVRYHHERWDGKGYPEGLKGEEIPIFSRIIAIADAYDAMVSGRPYRKPTSPFRAVNEILRCSGTQFDPALVELFISMRKGDEAVCSR